MGEDWEKGYKHFLFAVIVAETLGWNGVDGKLFVGKLSSGISPGFTEVRLSFTGIWIWSIMSLTNVKCFLNNSFFLCGFYNTITVTVEDVIVTLEDSYCYFRI